MICGLLFGFLVPPDRGEENVLWIMPLYGAFAGFIAVLPALVGFWVGLLSWTRRSARSVSSRAAVATLSAAGVALVFWAVVVTATTRGDGFLLGLFLGALTAVITAAIVGPATMRAARRADRADVGRSL